MVEGAGGTANGKAWVFIVKRGGIGDTEASRVNSVIAKVLFSLDCAERVFGEAEATGTATAVVGLSEAACDPEPLPWIAPLELTMVAVRWLESHCIPSTSSSSWRSCTS